MNTINELKNWIEANKMNDIYLPNNQNNKYVTDIGEGLEDVHGLFIWFLVDEKGNRSDIEIFKSEKDAVQFAYQKLLKRLNKNKI